MTNSEQEPSSAAVKIWTAASYHKDYEDTGCAFLVQPPNGDAYIVACTYPGTQDWNSTLANLAPIAMALDHFNIGQPIDLQVNADTARQVDDACTGKMDYDAPIDLLASFYEHADFIECVAPEKYDPEPRALLPDAAWFARKGSLVGLKYLEAKNGIPIHVVTPTIIGDPDYIPPQP